MDRRAFKAMPAELRGGSLEGSLRLRGKTSDRTHLPWARGRVPSVDQIAGRLQKAREAAQRARAESMSTNPLTFRK